MTTPQPNTTAASSSAVQAAAHSPRATAARYLATGTVAIPLAVTVVVICPHELAGATAGLLAAVATAALAELPRLYLDLRLCAPGQEGHGGRRHPGRYM